MNGARIAETSLMRANDERAEFCRAGQDIGEQVRKYRLVPAA
jgi:hypothetical protein